MKVQYLACIYTFAASPGDTAVAYLPTTSISANSAAFNGSSSMRFALQNSTSFGKRGSWRQLHIARDRGEASACLSTVPTGSLSSLGSTT